MHVMAGGTGVPGARWIVGIARTVALIAALSPALAAAKGDPLPSWNDGPAKQAILAFVAGATRPGTPAFVPPAERIATFDNDGTLWVEQPEYVQAMFAVDRVKALAPEHPDWKDKEPFKSVLAGDLKAALVGGEQDVLALVMATHAGMTSEEFTTVVRKWQATAQHPRFKQLYTKCIYQPMLEVLAYLRANGFKTYIVSGGGVDFMRPFTQQAYGIPPEQVVGSTIETKFEMRDGKPMLFREAKIGFIDDGPGKPVGIDTFIGHRPVFAFGNSDGDLQMLQWTAAGGRKPFMGIVHHTDGEREYAYDRNSPVGRLDKALDEAIAKGWTVVDMKQDWKKVFPFDGTDKREGS